MSLRGGSSFFLNLFKQTLCLNMQLSPISSILHSRWPFSCFRRTNFSETLFRQQSTVILHADAVVSRADCASHKCAVLSTLCALLIFLLWAESQLWPWRLLYLQPFGGYIVIAQGWRHGAGASLDDGGLWVGHGMSIQVVGEGIGIMHVCVFWQLLGEVVVIESSSSTV